MSRDILAGLVCGLVMGSFSLAAVVYIFFTNRDIYDQLARRLPHGIPPTLVMLLLVVGAPVAWCIFGAIAGALYHVAIDAFPGAGLGSSNSIFTIAIICITVLLMLPASFLIIRRKKLGWLFLTINLTFAVLFGWLLPMLAHWR